MNTVREKDAEKSTGDEVDGRADCNLISKIFLLLCLISFSPETRLDVRSVVNPRGCSNDGYSLEPISTCQRPVSVKSELEEPDYEMMDSPNDNDADDYQNVEGNDEDDDEYQNVEGIRR